MNAFHTMHDTYYVSKDGTKAGINEGTLINNGREFEYTQGVETVIEGITKAMLGKVANYSQLCEEFILVMSEGTRVEVNESIQKYKDIDATIVEAYWELGADKMKALKYRKGAIGKALILNDSLTSNAYKIASMVNIRKAEFISSADAKAKMQKAYDALGIKKKAKGSDINGIYITKDARILKDKKTVRGYVIVDYKVRRKKSIQTREYELAN